MLKIIVALIITGSISTALPVHAQDTIGITVTPITDEFIIKPGEVKSRTVSVINPGEEFITLYPVVLDFTTDNENGQPTFFAGNDESRSYTLSSWVQLDKEFIRVAANEEEKFKVTISAPEDAEPGGHYGAILFSTKPPSLEQSDQSQVGVVGLVGTLLLATVPGKINEDLVIEQFDVPRIVFGSPVNIGLTFKNLGNIHLKPKGDIVIRNWSGNQTSALPFNEGGGNVLPESKRRFENSWQLSLRNIGLYTVTASATYGSDATELIVSKKIFVLPYWLLIALLLITIYIIATITKRRRQTPTPTNQVSRPILR